MKQQKKKENFLFPVGVLGDLKPVYSGLYAKRDLKLYTARKTKIDTVINCQ
jgi:hypothetical protein